MQMPMLGIWRGCNHVQLTGHIVEQYGRATAVLSFGSNSVTADITLDTAQPNTRYDVRLIQVPRSQLTCNPGDPGVTAGGFETNAAGAGGMQLSAPITSGATGIWVAVDRPAAHSQTPAEFYTGDFIAKI